MKEAADLDASRDADWTLFEPVKNFIDKRQSSFAMLDDPKELYRQGS